MSGAPNAYKLEQAFSALMSARHRLEEDGEIVSDFDQIADNAQELLEQTLRAAIEAEAMGDAATARADDMKTRAGRYYRRSEALRAAAFQAMAALEMKKLQLPDLTAGLRSGTPSAQIIDEAAIPDDYKEEVVTTKINKAAILSALKNGFTVPGCELSNGVPTLSIRVR